MIWARLERKHQEHEKAGGTDLSWGPWASATLSPKPATLPPSSSHEKGSRSTGHLDRLCSRLCVRPFLTLGIDSVGM